MYVQWYRSIVTAWLQCTYDQLEYILGHLQNLINSLVCSLPVPTLLYKIIFFKSAYSFELFTNINNKRNNVPSRADVLVYVFFVLSVKFKWPLKSQLMQET